MKLEPCPFCGKNVAETTNIQNCEMCANFEDEEMCPSYEECGYGHFVVCNVNKGGCGASTGWYQTVEEAVSKWNKRAFIKCVDCVSRTPAKDPDCCFCNNLKSPCYQSEVRDSDFCAWGRDWMEGR